MHKSRIFLYILVSFISGVGIGSFANIVPWMLIIGIAIGGLCVVLGWRRDWRFVVGGLCIVVGLFGISRAGAYKTQQTILNQFADTKVRIEMIGYIGDEPQMTAQQKFTFVVKEIHLPHYRTMTNERILVTAKSYPQYHYGDRLSIIGPIALPQAGGEFNYRNYLAKDGIFTTVSFADIASNAIQLPLLERFQVRLFRTIFIVKQRFQESIRHSISEPNAAFMNGILLGSKENLPDQIKQDFQRTSMTHVLAVSGYNITIVAEIISMFLLLFLRRGVAFWFAVVGILIFTIMTGAQASVLRAAVMGIILILARREGRLYSGLNGIILAAVIMLYFNPLMLRYDVGFQLSFAATLGLLLLQPRLEPFLERVPNTLLFREALAMTLSAQLFVLPLILYYFKNLSVVGLPANLIVVPTIPYAMILGFAAGLAGMVNSFFGQLIGYFGWFVTTVQLSIVRLFAAPSWSAISIGISWSGLVVGYLVIFAVVFKEKLFGFFRKKYQ